MKNHTYFDLGKQALSNVFKTEFPGYVCPICLGVFETVGNSTEGNWLTEEHVPPKSIGGKVLCLTCRKCNCPAGGEIDAELAREKCSRSFISIDGQSRPAKLIVNGLALNIEQTWTDTRAHFHVLIERNDPKVVNAAKKILLEMPSGTELTLRDVVAYKPKDADVAYLKSAYLAAFAWLGYSYILRPALDRVRQQIKDPGCRALNAFRFYPRGFAPFKNGFLLFDEPFSCLAVKIGDSAVCLPEPNSDDLFYDELTKLCAGGASLAWRGCKKIRWPETFELSLDFAAPSVIS